MAPDPTLPFGDAGGGPLDALEAPGAIAHEALELLLDRLQRHAEAGHHLGSGALALDQQPEQEMLRPDIGVSQAVRLVTRERHDTLGARCVGEDALLLGAAQADDGPHGLSHEINRGDRETTPVVRRLAAVSAGTGGS